MRLWQALEDLPGLAAVKAEWKSLLGDELAFTEQFLRPRQQLAGSFPRLEPTGPGMPYRVVDHGDGSFVGVCDESGESIPLRKADLIVHEFDRCRFASSLAAILGFEPGIAPMSRNTGMNSVGSFVSASGTRFHGFLTVPHDSNDLKEAAAELVAYKQSPFTLFAPTRRFQTPAVDTIVRANASVFSALADIVTISGTEKLQVAPDIIGLLTEGRVTTVSDEPLSDRAESMLVAMLDLNAFDADRRRSTATIASTAFRATYDVNSLKPVVVELKRRGLIATKKGPRGGCWLTERGKLRAQKLKMASAEKV
jgi:hypothetical protein